MNHNHTTDPFSVSIQTCKHTRTHASRLWFPLSTECRSHCFSPHSHKEAQELNFLIKSDISSLLHIKSFHDPCLTCTSHNLEYSKDKHRIFTHGARTLERFTFRKEVVDKFYFLPFFSLPKKILFQETWEQCLSVIVVFPLNVWEPRVQSLLGIDSKGAWVPLIILSKCGH